MNKLNEEQKKLVLDNMALVTYIIKNKIHIGHDEFEDLFQEGCYYLCQASLNFNPDLGFKFSTYASSLIWGGLRRYKRDKAAQGHGLKVSRTLRDDMNHVEMIAIRENLDLENKSDLELILESLGISEYKPIVMTSMQTEITGKDKSTSTLGELIPDKINPYDEVECQIFVEELLHEFQKVLSDNGFKVMSAICYNYLNSGVVMTQNEVAEMFGMSQPQVSRILNTCKKIALKYTN